MRLVGRRAGLHESRGTPQELPESGRAPPAPSADASVGAHRRRLASAAPGRLPENGGETGVRRTGGNRPGFSTRIAPSRVPRSKFRWLVIVRIRKKYRTTSGSHLGNQLVERDEVRFPRRHLHHLAVLDDRDELVNQHASPSPDHIRGPAAPPGRPGRWRYGRPRRCRTMRS
ncbi:MAG: hypothetical protein MZV64_74240 [Ignavibacteriales bacterium]|nr:hypothetical protein [Ignavibacteriales bacterium]